MPNTIIELGKALLNIESEADYLELKETHSSQLFEDTWESLTDESHAHINEVIKNNPVSEKLKPLIEEIINAQTLEVLKEIKTNNPRLLVSKAWEVIELNYPQEVLRIKELSQVSKRDNNSENKIIQTQLKKEIKEIKAELVGIINKANELNNRLSSLSNQLSSLL